MKLRRIKPGIHPGMSNEMYHAQADVLSSSTARKLVTDGGPAEYHYFTQHPRERNTTFELGTVFHSLTLEGNLGLVDEMPFEEYRTNEAKSARDASLAAGRIPMKAKELEVVKRMTDAVYADPEAAELLEAAPIREASMFVDHFGTPLRARPDACSLENGLMLDAKSAADASREGFRKASGNYGYFAQDPWYSDVAEMLTGKSFDFAFIVAESHPPYRVGVYRHTEYARGLGRKMNDHAINVWNKCRESGIWPGYTRRGKVELMPWDEATVHETVE